MRLQDSLDLTPSQQRSSQAKCWKAYVTCASSDGVQAKLLSYSRMQSKAATTEMIVITFLEMQERLAFKGLGEHSTLTWHKYSREERKIHLRPAIPVTSPFSTDLIAVAVPANIVCYDGSFRRLTPYTSLHLQAVLGKGCSECGTLSSTISRECSPNKRSVSLPHGAPPYWYRTNMWTRKKYLS